MKSFSQSISDRTDRYAASEEIKNQIDRLIDEHLTTEVNGEVVNDSNLTIEGREELIKHLENLISAEKIKQRISILESKKTEKSEAPKSTKEEITMITESVNEEKITMITESVDTSDELPQNVMNFFNLKNETNV